MYVYVFFHFHTVEHLERNLLAYACTHSCSEQADVLVCDQTLKKLLTQCWSLNTLMRGLIKCDRIAGRVYSWLVADLHTDCCSVDTGTFSGMTKTQQTVSGSMRVGLR